MGFGKLSARLLGRCALRAAVALLGSQPPENVDVSVAVSKHFLRSSPRRTGASSVQAALLEQLEFALADS
jgi:hypothetical protein